MGAAPAATASVGTGTARVGTGTARVGTAASAVQAERSSAAACVHGNSGLVIVGVSPCEP
jgi:hypothetical protein